MFSARFCPYFACVLLALSGCGGGGSTPVVSCEPGAHFTAPDGCNTCICPKNGDAADASCTEIACAVSCLDNGDCGESEFCRFSVFGICPGNTGDYAGACEKRPDICPQGGAGVCGCGGAVALNECLLYQQGINPAPCPN